MLYIWSDIDDCTVVADLETRRRMIRYIRKYSPDIVFTHRTNDYHADHRAAGQHVQDASYLLTVPNECPDVPAMYQMPVIMFLDDTFKYPPFEAEVVVDIDENIETKLKCAHLNQSQVYEWLAYERGEEVPEGEEALFEWLKGINITPDATDDGNFQRLCGAFCKNTCSFSQELIEKYGEERGSKVRYAGAFALSEYGRQLTEETKKYYFHFK